jgi:hypothetical protein
MENSATCTVRKGQPPPVAIRSRRDRFIERLKTHDSAAVTLLSQPPRPRAVAGADIEHDIDRLLLE